MKKHIYLLLPLLTLAPTLATQKIITSTIIASTLVLSHSSYNKTLSLRLHQAVEQNNTTNALQLINNSQVDIHAKVDYGTEEWQKGWTPLIQCARNGDESLKIAQALLGHKHINVNLQDKLGCTPLIWCCYEGDKSLHIAQALLKHQHINVNLQNNDGLTPLIQCCWKGDDALHIAQTLLGHQHINVNLGDNDGDTPLMWCCREGDDALHIAQLLLKHQHINVNLQQNDGWTPLIRCALTGDDALQIAQELLKDKHINVNLQDKLGCTPLDSIIHWIKDNKKNYKYVQLWNLLVAQGGILKKRKADYQNLKPSNFNEPHKDYVQAIKNNPPKNCIHHDTLYQAIKQGNTILAQNLINKPYVDVNAKTNGTTPLIQCCKTGDKSLHIAQALLGHKHINVNLQTKDGWTPLIWCARKGDDALHIAQELLKHQHINVNLQNNYGRTPLMMCAYSGDKSLHIAQALLGHKDINVNLQDEDGCTPLDSIIYWIKQNKENYKYVQLWNLLVAQGGILKKRKADYENLKLSDFNEPQKSYVQAIKNGPVMIISLKLSSLTQENERQRTQLEKLQKTSTQQLDHKNNTINKLKDQTHRLNNQLATANQLKDKQQQTIQQKNETIKNHLNTIETHLKKISSLQEHSDNFKHTFATFQQTIQQKNETIKNHLNTIDNQKNTIQHKNKDIRKLKDQTQRLTNQLATANQLKDKQQQTINRLHRSQKDLQKAKNELKDKLDTTKQQIQQLTNQLNTAKQHNSLLNKEITILKQNFNEELSLSLCDAIDEQNYTLAQQLINNPQVNINIKDENGLTPLLWCCFDGDISLNITTLLLQHPHIQINVKDTYHKNPLHHTCAKGALKTLHLLLNQPTIHQILNQQDHQKNTPLDTLFEHITGQHPDTTHVTAWSMLVLQGALLNQHIQNYQQLHPSNFKNLQKTYVHLIKQTPPKKLSSKKQPTLPQNNLNTKFMDHEEETKEDE